MLLSMRTLAFMLLCAVAARGGSTESGVPSARGIHQEPETAEKDLPVKARLALDALGPAARAAARAWPGYDVLRKPLLVTFADGTALLVGHPAPPPDFRRITRRGTTAHVAEGRPPLNASFRLDYEFAGERVTAVREEPGDTPGQLILLAVHEMFHDDQKAFWTMPRGGMYEVEDGEDVALAALENRALASWLDTRDERDLRDFAALRLRRRALFPGTQAEILQENLEGPADYVEEAAQRAFEGPEAARAPLLKKLRAPLHAKDMPKLRLYGVGAALGLALESWTPGTWQSAVRTGWPMSQMVLGRLALGQDEAEERAARLASGPEYESLLAAGRRDVEDRGRRREEHRTRFKSRPGRRIVLSDRNLRGGFRDDGDWFEYPDTSRLHEHVLEWSGEGKAGSFRLSDMPVLEWCRGGDRIIEFFAGPKAEILVDGRPWKPARAAREFRSLLILSRGVDLKLDGGRIESLDGALYVFPAAD